MEIKQRVSILRLRSGLSDRELGLLFGVQRMTVFNWSEGRTVPRGILGRAADKVSALLLSAQSRGLLPLPRELTKEQRAVRVARMREHIVGAITKS